MEAYCVKCKEKREMKDPFPTFTTAGAPMTRGVRPVCGTNLVKMGNTLEHEGLEKPVVEKTKAPARKAASASKTAKTAKTTKTYRYPMRHPLLSSVIARRLVEHIVPIP